MAISGPLTSQASAQSSQSAGAISESSPSPEAENLLGSILSPLQDGYAGSSDALGALPGSSEIVPQGVIDQISNVLSLLPQTFDADDPFYIPPEELPEGHGTLIRTQDAQDLLGLATGAWPAKATRILHTTMRSDGKPTAVSGTVFEPTVPWTGGGERPTIALAPGTRGGANVCAPSRGLFLAGALDPASLALGVNYELPVAYLAAMAGIRVVMTDYIGLGTPGVHTYVNGEEEAHAVLDSTRAALTLAGAPKDAPVGFWGYSQGGGATAAAAERLSSYAPEINLKGTYSGAPPAELEAVMNGVDGTAIVGVLGMALAGFVDRNPEVLAEVEPAVNEEGMHFLKQTSQMCIPDALLAWGGRNTRHLSIDGRPIGEHVPEAPKLAADVRAQQIGFRPLTAPMMVFSSVHDDAVPYPQARQMAVDFCENSDQPVFFRKNELPALIPGSALNHALPLFIGMPESLQFLHDRFTDKPAPDNCGQF